MHHGRGARGGPRTPSRPGREREGKRSLVFPGVCTGTGAQRLHPCHMTGRLPGRSRGEPGAATGGGLERDLQGARAIPPLASGRGVRFNPHVPTPSFRRLLWVTLCVLWPQWSRGLGGPESRRTFPAPGLRIQPPPPEQHTRVVLGVQAAHCLHCPGSGLPPSHRDSLLTEEPPGGDDPVPTLSLTGGSPGTRGARGKHTVPPPASLASIPAGLRDALGPLCPPPCPQGLCSPPGDQTCSGGIGHSRHLNRPGGRRPWSLNFTRETSANSPPNRALAFLSAHEPGPASMMLILIIGNKAPRSWAFPGSLTQC